MKNFKHFFSAAILAFTFTQTAIGQAVNYPDGSTVANFELIDTDGNSYTLDEIVATGQYVLIEFFSSDCGLLCNTSAPIFNEVYDVHGCNFGDVFVISVSGLSTDDNAAVLAYDAEYGGDFNHCPLVPGIDGDNSTGDDVAAVFGVDLAPTFCLISPDKIMINNDIWPVGSVETFTNAFPPGEAPTEMACTGVSLPEEFVSELSLFPNPVVSELNVQYTSPNNSPIKMEIINLLGETIQVEQLNSSAGTNNHSIDVSMLESGQYIIRLIHDDLSTVHQFQKY